MRRYGMNNSGEYENNNDYFKDNIDKQEGYKMSDCLTPYCKNVIMSIQGFDNDEQLKEHLSHVIENDNLYVFFGIVEKEFNQFLNCDLKFVFPHGIIKIILSLDNMKIRFS